MAFKETPMGTSCKWFAIVAIVAVPTMSTAGGTERGVRFDSPQVLDLAARSLKAPPTKSMSVSILGADDAQRILAAAALDQAHATLTFSDELFGCGTEAKDCLRTHEKTLLAAASSVRRDGAAIDIKVGNSGSIRFVDWTMPTTKTADGDEETHWYLGTLPGSGYERVEVQFGHDAPGSFLINAKSGKVAFVHNGSDIVAPAPDGLHLLTFNVDNPPLSLRVAVLDASGPRVELQCAAAEKDEATSAQFKGWHAQAADIELTVKNKPPVALRIGHEGENWTAAASDPKGLAALSFACRQ
jgi:hypothetical protein